MPVAPGRHLAILVEVAARNQLLKERGFDAARSLAARVEAEIGAGSPKPAPRPRSAPRSRGRRR
jgi:HPr kinase/phosphorylase